MPGRNARGHVVASVVVYVVNQAALPHQADQRRKKCLSYAKGHVHALRLAPFGHNVAMPDDQAGGGPASLHRTDCGEIGFGGAKRGR